VDKAPTSAPTPTPITPFPASRRSYLPGSRPDLRVPVREIALSPTSGRFGEEENPPVRVYDTSGPHGDPAVTTDIHAGLPTLRRHWIIERGDVEPCPGGWSSPATMGSARAIRARIWRFSRAGGAIRCAPSPDGP